VYLLTRICGIATFVVKLFSGQRLVAVVGKRAMRLGLACILHITIPISDVHG